MSEEKTCQYCGKPIEKDCNICPHCGKKINNNISEKNGRICLILNRMIGLFSHRFYVGKIVSATILCIFSIFISSVSLMLMFFINDFYSYIPSGYTGYILFGYILFFMIFLIVYIIGIVDFIQLINEKFTCCKGKYIKIDEKEIENKKCKSCGKFIEKNCLICPYCKAKNNNTFSEKDSIIYLFLLILLGLPFLIHRFYIGKIKSTIIILLGSIINVITWIILLNITKIFISLDLINFSKTTYIIGIIIGNIFIVWINDLIQFFRGEAKDSTGEYIIK